jgi:hypothetical protein
MQALFPDFLYFPTLSAVPKQAVSEFFWDPLAHD